MGLMVPIYFTKSNHIGTIKSVQGDFSVYFKLLFFCSTSGTGFDKLIPPVLGPLFSGMPHPQALSNEVNIIWSPEGLQEVSEFICLEGTLCHSILQYQCFKRGRILCLIFPSGREVASMILCFIIRSRSDLISMILDLLFRNQK